VYVNVYLIDGSAADPVQVGTLIVDPEALLYSSQHLFHNGSLKWNFWIINLGN